MRLRRHAEREKLRQRLDAAEREAAEAEAAHREAVADELARWGEVPRAERVPEDVRRALARRATAEQYRRLALARVEADSARRRAES